MHSLAQHLQSQGRGNDTVLVHMTPREVGGLQALAQSAGGTLTRNPTTGLPEAGFLDSILPMIAGVAGGAIGMDPWMAAAGVGAITGIATGNLEKGLMSGLGAYGGAALGRTINPEGMSGIFGSPAAAAAAAAPTPSLTTINTAPVAPFTPNLPVDETGAFTEGAVPFNTRTLSPSYTSPTIKLDNAAYAAPTSIDQDNSFFGRFSANAARGLEDTGLEKFAPYAAGLGLATPFLGSSSSGLGALKPAEPKKLPPPRMFNRTPVYPVNRDPRDSSEFMFFPPEVPYYPAYADGGAVEARPRFAPDVAAPAGYAAQAPARSYVEQLYNFPRATNVPKLVKPTAETAALQAQYPTATKAQLSEYERAIAGGGDPSATRSLMQAYGPTSGIKELQPWSPDFKGFDYARSRPVDAFGNPIGWDAPTKTAPTMGANGVPSGWDPRDWENMKNTDLGSPSDEYILNNPWMGGMQFGPAPLISQLAPMAVSKDPSTGQNTYKPQPEPEFTSRRLENAYNIGLADKAAKEAGAANNQTALNYNLYGGPDAPEGAVTPEGFAPKTTPSTGSTFLNYLNQNMAAPRSTSTAAPSVGFFNNPVEYVGNKISDTYNDLRNIGNWTTGEFVNAGLNALPTGIPGVVGGMLAGGIGVPLPEGRSYVTSPPLSYQAGREAREFIQNLFKPKGQAAGGVDLHDGSFVVDARTVAELGNGSSGAGQELLARMGGKPIKGPGDGVSDSIRANIGGKQEARVARDEVKFDPEAVKRVGGGNPKKGADRLYAMMRKAEKARKSASRGKDTGLRALVGEK